MSEVVENKTGESNRKKGFTEFISDLNAQVTICKKQVEWLEGSPADSLTEQEKSKKLLQFVREVTYLIKNYEGSIVTD